MQIPSCMDSSHKRLLGLQVRILGQNQKENIEVPERGNDDRQKSTVVGSVNMASIDIRVE